MKVLFRQISASVFVFLLAANAGAQTRCPVPLGASPALAQVDGLTRLGLIRTVMRDQARRARTWMWGWSLGGLGLAAGNYVLAGLATTKDEALDPLVGGTTSFFIPAAILVKPLRAPSDQAALERYIAETTTTLGPMEPCLQLAVAEELLTETADDEELSAGILTHALAIGGNTAIALFLGIGFKHWTGGLLNGLGGLAISEVQIFTQPTGAVHALEAYRRGEVAAPAPGVAWSLAPLMLGDARGFAIVGAF